MSATVAGVTGTAQTTSAATATTAQDTQDRFLKLLVAQMKNQDPLNPMDNAAVTTQMAQIQTVSGIDKLNSTLQAFTQAQSFQAVGMIGHNVLAPGKILNLSGGAAVGGFDLPQAADSVKVSVLDSNSQVVRVLDLGKADSGASTFSWDGTTTAGTTAPDGTYTFQVAASLSGANVTATSLAVGAVNSVLMDQTGPSLNVSGLGLVDLAQVKQIL